MCAAYFGHPVPADPGVATFSSRAVLSRTDLAGPLLLSSTSWKAVHQTVQPGSFNPFHGSAPEGTLQPAEAGFSLLAVPGARPSEVGPTQSEGAAVPYEEPALWAAFDRNKLEEAR